jgi:3D (Asp-Asp-Asp) domain-containing protein
MSYRKELLFVVVIVGAIFGLHTNKALASTTDLGLIQSYNYQEDPYLIEWTFNSTLVSKHIEQNEPTFEDKILNKWKEKQAHMWVNLPTDSFTINASAYTASADECGKTDGKTASGLKVAEKRTLACPREYPFGTQVSIEGMGEYRCEDRGGAIKGNHFDIYVKTKSEAFAFGRQHLTAHVVIQ